MPSALNNQRILIRVTIVLAVIEALGMWLMLNGALPVPRDWLISYHTIILLLVSLVAVSILLRASQPDRFDTLAVLAFGSILVVFNPFYPLLLTTVHTLIASLAVVACLVWALRRPSVVG